jgi:hypothetical protein
MADFKAKLQINGNKASLCFIPFWIRKLSGKCLLLWTCGDLLMVRLLSHTNNTRTADGMHFY